MLKENKKVVLDIVLNIFSAVLPISTLQLIIYPYIANDLGGNEYGLMLTIYSIWMLLPFSLGNVLNNIKLLTFPQYEKLGNNGDISLLLRRWLIISSLAVFVLIWIYCSSFNFVHIYIGTVIACLIFLKAYLEVGFRIDLNYTYVLYSNILLCLGFLIGLFFYSFFRIWEFIFLLGYFFSSVFCILTTKLLNEKPNKTVLYHDIKRDAFSLVTAAVIKNLTVFADKLVLYPLMGGLTVSVYYTATLLGKVTGMLAGPINSVVLSYIARWDKSKANILKKIIFISFFVGIIGYVIVLLLARPIIKILFPQWLDEVIEIIPLTTVTIMLGIITSILHPFVLKYCKMQWQIGINTVGSFIYFSSALILWNFMGLKGFCIGTIIGALSKLAIMIFIYYKSIKFT